MGIAIFLFLQDNAMWYCGCGCGCGTTAALAFLHGTNMTLPRAARLSMGHITIL